MLVASIGVQNILQGISVTATPVIHSGRYHFHFDADALFLGFCRLLRSFQFPGTEISVVSVHAGGGRISTIWEPQSPGKRWRWIPCQNWIHVACQINFNFSKSPCYKYFQEGRLVVLSLQIGDGSRQILIYNAYGYSGARWNHGLKSQTHALIESALQDSISPGLPALFGGDLNLQLDESSVLQRMTQFDWFHLPSLCNSATTSTCFKGKGSAIDHIFCNSLAFNAFTSFSIGSCISDHASLQCTFSLQVISQTVHRNRTMTFLTTKFQFPTPLSSPVLQLGKNFSAFLQKGDIASAYKLWCNYAEAHLNTLWTHVDEMPSLQKDVGVCVWTHMPCGLFLILTVQLLFMPDDSGN